MPTNYFEGASQFDMNNVSITHISNSSTSSNAIEKLFGFASQGASHESQERYPFPQCYPGTQEGTLIGIRQWFTNASVQKPILWLFGPTGMGKTTIAQTVAQEMEPKGQLAAAFFFSRSSAERNDSSKFVATLALQMALKIPQLKPLVEDAVQHDPTIFFKAPPVQLEKLIIQPCKALQFTDGKRWLIIVDGLDECLGPPESDREQEQELVLNLLLPLLSHSFPFCILLSSRAEEWLKTAFGEEPFSTMSDRLPLYPTTKRDEDIWHYIDKEFERICDSPRFSRAMEKEGKPWPSINIRRLLVEKACGQFIYVTTAIKFIDNRWSTPPEQLKKLLGAISRPGEESNIFSGLEDLYMDILKSCPNKDAMVRSLGEIMCVQITYSHDLWQVLDTLFGRSNGATYGALRGVHSIVDVENFTQTKRAVFHSSFQDFITSTRAGEFFIDIPMTHTRFLCKCLDLLALRDRRNVVYKYAFFAWRRHHLPGARITEELVDRLLNFDFKGWFIDECVANADAPAHWFPNLAEWAWDHGLFQQWQLNDILKESESFQLKARQCTKHFRSSYDAAMVWFLDNNELHRDGRYKRLLDACFVHMAQNVENNRDHLSVVASEDHELDYPLLAVRGEPSIVDFLDQGLVNPWSLYAAPSSISAGHFAEFLDERTLAWDEALSPGRMQAQEVLNVADLACGIQFHVFPPSLLAFLADKSRSKHHYYVSPDMIQSVLCKMLEDSSGLQMILDYTRVMSKVAQANSSRALELPFSPWFNVLCLFIKLACTGSHVIGALLKKHGPTVLGVMDALGYYHMQKRFKEAAARHLPQGWEMHHKSIR